MWTNQQILAEQLVRISEGVAISLHVVENLHPSICYACQQANLLPINIAAIPIFPVKFQTTSRDYFIIWQWC